MLVIDNFDKVNNIVQWNPEQSYYKFNALLRAKDFEESNKSQLLKCNRNDYQIKYWFVESEKYFNEVKEDMKYIAETFKCRIYMTIDRKSTMKTIKSSLETSLKYISLYLGNDKPQMSVKALNKMMSSCANLSESSDKECKRWMFDIDSKDEQLLKFVKEQICGEHYLETFESINGYHVIANKKFNAKAIMGQYDLQNVELKDNSLVLVAMGV